MRKSEIKEDLLDQLAARNMDISVFRSLIDDYMRLWDVKESLLKDIKKNGIRVTTKNGNGFEVTKFNESVDRVPKIENQMLTILLKLGLHEPIDIEDSEEDYM